MLIFFLLFPYVACVYGQADLPDSISSSVAERLLKYELGYSHLRMQDVQVTPFIYRSDKVPIGAEFESFKNNRILSFRFSLCGGALQNKSFPDRVFFKNSTNNEGELVQDRYDMGQFPLIQEGIRFQYLKKIDVFSGSDFELYAGGYINQLFLISFTVVPIFVISELNIGPSMLLGYRIDQQTSFRAMLSAPLAGIMSRLPYSNDPADGKHGSFMSVYTTGTSFSHPVNHQKLDFSLSFTRRLNRKWAVGSVYGFQWMNYSPNRGVELYENTLAIQFIRTLKS